MPNATRRGAVEAALVALGLILAMLFALFYLGPEFDRYDHAKPGASATPCSHYVDGDRCVER